MTRNHLNISTANNEQQCKKGDCQIASIPRKKALAEALSATGSAHHDYNIFSAVFGMSNGQVFMLHTFSGD